MRAPRSPRLLSALVVLATVAAPAWAAAATRVFPLSAARPLPPGLEGTPERLTKAVAQLVGGDIAESSITAAAMALGCTIDDSTCLDQLARANRVSELVFGTIRVSDDLRVFVKLTRFIAGTERRERTFVLTSESASALGKQLVRAARDMFDLADDAPGPDAIVSTGRRGERAERGERAQGGERAEAGERRERGKRGARKPRRGGRGGGDRGAGLDEDPLAGGGSLAGLEPRGDGELRDGELRDGDDAPRGAITTGTYALLGGGLASAAIGAGLLYASYSLRTAILNAPTETTDDLLRLAELERVGKLRLRAGGALLAVGVIASGAGVARAIAQRRPVPEASGVAVVPMPGGAALVFAGRFR